MNVPVVKSLEFSGQGLLSLYLWIIGEACCLQPVRVPLAGCGLGGHAALASQPCWLHQQRRMQRGWAAANRRGSFLPVERAEEPRPPPDPTEILKQNTPRAKDIIRTDRINALFKSNKPQRGFPNNGWTGDGKSESDPPHGISVSNSDNLHCC